MKPRAGLPIAFDAEAWCLFGAGRWRRFGGRTVRVSPLPCGAEILALRSGLGRRNGLQASRWLIGEGARALLSIGVAGGLHPNIRTGEVIVGDKIIDAGEGQLEEWESDTACTRLIHSALLAEGIRSRKGTIITLGEPITSPKGKRELYRRNRALVSDMESGSIARAAAESRIPFLALRVVVDSPERNVDPDLCGCLDDSGRISFPMLWRNLCRRPSLLPEMLCMTKDFVTALSSLRNAWHAGILHAIPSLLRG